ncbi:MAG TPA: gamma-glutamyltransferase [Chloroflexota bacterium]|nr:gamma-glutamyltransferase [Chloroflexota bacterium]
MVASASPVAAAVGLQVLQDGGNAIDAAIATALVEHLTLPSACGLGGDCFAVLYHAKSRAVYAINGSGIAARKASRDYYVSRGHTSMPLAGIHSASVPGAPDAYFTLYQRFGTKPLPELAAAAISMAEDGYAVDERLARAINGAQRKLNEHSPAGSSFLPGGAAPRAGQRLKHPAYGRTLRTFAEQGAEPFYRGAIAREIARAAQAAGGLLEESDFVDHETELYTPLRTTYRGLEVHVTRPPSQGLLILEQLNLLEGFDLASSGWGTAETIHALAEAKKLAYADRLRYAGDPRFVDFPLDKLISKEFAARRRKAIDPQRAAEKVEGALREQVDGDTSYFCVADAEGNAISFIHSLSAGWGSGFTAGETGMLLNNRAGRGFTLDEGHPNVIEGGKRTMHTLNCYLLMKDGALYGVGGTPGGDQQPQWNVQTITGLVDFGFDPQIAVDAPRFYSYPSTDPSDVNNPFDLRLESRFGPEVFAGLEARGHRVKDLGAWGSPGALQLILRNADGVLMGGSDSRVGGVALTF